MNALTLANLSVDVAGRRVINGASHAFAANTVTAVVGRTGAGKSVLMKAACGLLPHSSGSVVVLRPPAIFVHQDPAVMDELDVVHNVAFGVVRDRAIARTACAARVGDALDLLQRRPWARVPVAELATAVKKRVALARAWCLRPSVLVVDEPTTGLDASAASSVDRALTDLAHHTTLIIVTHSARTLAALRPAIVVVNSDGTLTRAQEHINV